MARAVALNCAIRPSAAQDGPVLGGVKGTLASLGGSAALDPACAPGPRGSCRRRCFVKPAKGLPTAKSRRRGGHSGSHST